MLRAGGVGEIVGEVSGAFARHYDAHGANNAFHSGGDVHICGDANFHQRHQRTAGDCPPFYDPTYFISKTTVDAVGKRIDAARKRPVKTGYVPKLPEVVLKACEKSFEAADESAEKSSGSKFDDNGVFAIVCRHDIPLFLANVDTPGEQQKYVIALTETLMDHLPSQATLVELYDIGCLTHTSVEKVRILAPSSTFTC